MEDLVAMLDRAASMDNGGAVFDEHRSLTFAECRDAALRLAGCLADLTDRRRVGILLPSGTSFAVSFFAVLSAGRVAVPLNLFLSEKELARSAAEAGIDLVLTARPLEAVARAFAERMLLVDGFDFGAAEPIAAPPGRPRPDDVAVLLYTSGTTAAPRGVMLTHRNLLSNAAACCRAAGLESGHVLLGLLPLFHAFGLLTSLVAPVYLGAKVALPGRFQPASAAEMISRHRPTVMLAVPSVYGVLLRSGALERVDLSSLRLCIAGGEPLPAALGTAFQGQTGLPLLEGYGLTEASPVVTLNRPGAPRAGTAGPPLPGVEVRVVGSEGEDLPAGAEGEVWVRGPNVMAGYYDRPEETAAALTEDGWLRTGDIGRLDDAGCLSITGRLKEVIICGGENVAPREVEEVLLAHPAVAEAAVVGVPDPVRGEVPRAFVSLREGCSCSAADLGEFCRRHLANFKVPREVVFRTDLPRTPTGKIHRRLLREGTTP